MALTLRTANYSIARMQIADGDVILMRSGWFHSPLSFATRALLRTHYTHAALALELEGGLWVSEMWADGNVMVPLSQYKGAEWDAYACPVENRQRVRNQILVHMRDEIRYDMGDLARIAAHRLLGWPLPPRDDDRMICSSYVPHVLSEAGWTPATPLPSIMAPSDLPAWLRGPSVEYRPA